MQSVKTETHGIASVETTSRQGKSSKAKKTKTLVLTMGLLLSVPALSQAPRSFAKNPTAFVPAGYKIVTEMRGDLNGDQQEDVIFLVQATSKKGFVRDEALGMVDRNRRGLVIAFKNQDHYERALANLTCFSSENEDGGVYFAPELSLELAKGKLIVHYQHGRYGHWAYQFRYQNTRFELIGFDRSNNRGPIIESTESINFLTRKILIKENTKAVEQDDDRGFKARGKTFTLEKPIWLSEVADFDELDIQSLIQQSR